MTYTWIFIALVSALWIYRGVIRSQRSGFPFYIFSDLALAVAWVTYFATFYRVSEPGFAVLLILLGGVIAASLIEFQGRKRAAAEHPERFAAWEKGLAGMSMLDRVLWRYPKVADGRRPAGPSRTAPAHPEAAVADVSAGAHKAPGKRAKVGKSKR